MHVKPGAMDGFRTSVGENGKERETEKRAHTSTRQLV